jgi:hypothetical protein
MKIHLDQLEKFDYVKSISCKNNKIKIINNDQSFDEIALNPLNTKTITETDVIAPKEVEIKINSLNCQNMNVEILKFQEGDINVHEELCTFDNDANEFNYDEDNVIFDGVIKARKEYSLNMDKYSEFGKGFISETDKIDLSKFKKISSGMEILSTTPLNC